MNAASDIGRVSSVMVYGAYAWLMLSGLLQIGIDVISQHLRGVRKPGIETTLYYGLNTAYGLSQILFAALALSVAYQYGPQLLARSVGLCIGLVAAAAWLAFCLAFIAYPHPRTTVAVFALLLVVAAFTASANSR